MNNIQLRFILFLGLCIVIRIIFVLIAKYINRNLLPYLGIISLIPALGFIIIYLGNYRKKGGEVFGDKIWWNDLRPLHSLLYFTFSYMALTNTPNAYKALILDALIGFISFTLHHRQK